MNLKYSLALFFCAFTSLNEIVRWTVSDFQVIIYLMMEGGEKMEIFSFFER